MQLWRAQVDPFRAIPSKHLGSSLPPGNQEAEREGEASKAWEEETVASNTVALYLARFYGKTCCRCHLIPALGTDRSLQPAAWRDSICLSYVDTGIYLLFLTDINATASTSCSVLCPEGFLPSGLPPGSPQLAICLPHTVGKWPQDEQRGYTPPQVTRRRAYLDETSVSNPENLRNCEGWGEGAGVKGHRAFYCS